MTASLRLYWRETRQGPRRELFEWGGRPGDPIKVTNSRQRGPRSKRQEGIAKTLGDSHIALQKSCKNSESISIGICADANLRPSLIRRGAAKANRSGEKIMKNKEERKRKKD